MTELEIRAFENEILGDEESDARKKAEKMRYGQMGLKGFGELGSTVLEQFAGKSEQKADEAARKKAGLPSMTELEMQRYQQQQQAGQNPFTAKAGPLPVYGWLLVGAGGIGVIALIASMLKKK